MESSEKSDHAIVESISKTSLIMKSMKYSFPSLFAVDSFFKYWTANYETPNKKTNVKLKLKVRYFQKAVFGPRISETADKKTANIEGHLYSDCQHAFLLPGMSLTSR